MPPPAMNMEKANGWWSRPVFILLPPRFSPSGVRPNSAPQITSVSSSRPRCFKSLINAATSGNPRFFLGTDSAPHDRLHKESACGCAVVFSAHAAIELYAEAFDKVNKIERLEGFASHFGADFYGLDRNTDTIMLEKKSWQVPDSFEFSGSEVVPFFSGEDLSWRLVS